MLLSITFYIIIPHLIKMNKKKKLRGTFQDINTL